MGDTKGDFLMSIAEAEEKAMEIAKTGTRFMVRKDDFHGNPVAISCDGWDVLHLANSVRNNDCVQIIVDRLNKGAF